MMIASMLSSVLLVADMSIDAQIKKIKQASPQERYKLVNQLKEQIARMNALQQAHSISKYQEESLKAQHRAPIANQILFQEQLRQHEVDKSIVPPVKELPASKLKPTSMPAKIVPAPQPSYHDGSKYVKPQPEYHTPKPTYNQPKPDYHDMQKYTKPEYHDVPKPTYTKPKPSYHDRPKYTKPEYKAPKPTYTKPKPEYHEAPKPTYNKPKPSAPVKKPSLDSFGSQKGGF